MTNRNIGSWGKLVGVVTSGSRASEVPIRISRSSIDFVRDEMLVVIDDVEERRLYIGVVRGSVKRDIAIDGLSLPTNFDPERSLGYSAPLMTATVEIIGEVIDGSVMLSFSIPRPGSLVYVPEDSTLDMLIKLPEGLHVGYHKFSGLRIPVDPRALDYHIAVLGATGTGKSRLVKALVEEIIAKTSYNVLVFDHTGVDYSDPTRWNSNVKIVDGSTIALTLDVIAEILADKMRVSDYLADYIYGALTLYIAGIVLGGESGRSPRGSLDYAMGKLKDVSLERITEGYLELCRKGVLRWAFDDFMKALSKYLDYVGAYESTKVKLELLATMRVGKLFFESYLQRRNIVAGDVVDELLSGRSRLVIVDLSGEIEYEAKKFIVYQFLREVWDRILRSRTKANLVVVVDEAHNYACVRGCEPSLEMVARTAREGRKWGFGLVLASQRVFDLAPEVRGNINTVFFSRVQSASDYSELRGWIEGLKYIEYTLPLLARREFYISGLGNPLRKPMLVKVRDVS